jgi:hypothetical protein
MIAVLTRVNTPDISRSEREAIFNTLYWRGAMMPEEVASLLRLSEDDVAVFLADQASQGVLEFDPRFRRYCIWD